MGNIFHFCTNIEKFIDLEKIPNNIGSVQWRPQISQNSKNSFSDKIQVKW